MKRKSLSVDFFVSPTDPFPTLSADNTTTSGGWGGGVTDNETGQHEAE